MATFSDFHAVTAARRGPPAYVGAERLGLPVIGQHQGRRPARTIALRCLRRARLVVSHVGHVEVA
jgi:hypothetical protein